MSEEIVQVVFDEDECREALGAFGFQVSGFEVDGQGARANIYAKGVRMRVLVNTSAISEATAFNDKGDEIYTVRAHPLLSCGMGSVCMTFMLGLLLNTMMKATESYDAIRASRVTVSEEAN